MAMLNKQMVFFVSNAIASVRKRPKKGTDELYNELLSRLQQIPDAWRTWIWEVFRIVYNKHGDSKHGNTSWSFIEMGWGLSCSWD